MSASNFVAVLNNKEHVILVKEVSADYALSSSQEVFITESEYNQALLIFTVKQAMK